ncbi:MAG: transketolase [Candidatus Goldbacteria bacterium]|nr:transketolase [Candidatus Goldiibacteriota bacterium]
MKITEELSINTLRMLSIDMVERAKSGHPGLPLGAAPMIYTLYSKFIKHNPADPKWADRDRFILSAGHGSALLYSLLHLYGYGISLDDLKNFRQFKSITPGHPEYGLTPGVEATTGPLGQGFAMGVGMAIAEKTLAGCFNKRGHSIIDHYIYGIVSDGDLMEGVASEAASLAGTMKLGKIIYLYDDNGISIEGDTDISFTENVKARFEAYGWHTPVVADGNDTYDIERAIHEAKREKNRPSLIIIKTHIGFGSPRQDNAQAHGEPLGKENVIKTKQFFGWPEDREFYVPKEVSDNFKEMAKTGAEAQRDWNERVEAYRSSFPKENRLLDKYLSGSINEELKKNLEFFTAGEKIATRTASGKIMNIIEKYMTEFMGGSADLAPSTKTELKGQGSFGISGMCSRNIHFGVREHAMGAIVNGLALHGGIIPYSATFLIFSDYMRPAIRLAALMKTHSIFVFTHDSIGLGEDGPTHQPVEQLPSLRMIPGLTVIRPADANETVAAWYMAVTQKMPFALVFTRQDLPVLDNEKYKVFENAQKGGYVLEHGGEKPDVLIIATGSEVHPALKAAELLRNRHLTARVVSLPSYEMFLRQTEVYRESVIPSHLTKRIVVEASHPAFFKGLAGDNGTVIGVEKFGASAPGDKVMENYGMAAENIAAKAAELLKKN